MGWWLVFAVFLYVACAVLIVAEVFLPSGGVLSLCALASVVGGVLLFFRHSPTAGLVGVIVGVVMVPLQLVFAYKLLPRTRFGRHVILSPPTRQRGDAIADAPELAKLAGCAGRVLTPLRPVGTCEFDGRKVECVAESGYVQRGRTVEVIRIEGTQVTVRVREEA